MRKVNSVILILFTGFLSILNAQEATISYAYDESGNLVERRVQVFPQARLAKFGTVPDSTPPINTDLRVYPNPTQEYIIIDGKLPEDVTSSEIHLLDINGHLLMNEKYFGNSKTISLYGNAKGIYLLELIYNNKKRCTYKIILN